MAKNGKYMIQERQYRKQKVYFDIFLLLIRTNILANQKVDNVDQGFYSSTPFTVNRMQHKVPF